MRNLYLIPALALLIGTGSIAMAQSPSPADQATPKEIQATHHQARAQPALDPIHFCYYKNDAYSEGSVLGNLKCSTPQVMMIGNPNPLVWKPVVRK